METVYIVLPQSKKEIVVSVERKEIKTCRLKVYPDCSVKISIPAVVPAEWVEKYLCDKSEWIEKNINLFTQTTGYAATNEIHNGYSIRIFGEDYIFSVAESKKNYVYREGKRVCIGTADINNQEKIKSQFEKWWRKESLLFLTQRVEEYYPIIKKYGHDIPTIQIKKMKTLWGSCSVNKKTVYFNQYLIKARPACIDYVVLHELIHFIYPNHSKQFYDYLSIYMPDWKERKKALDMDVVHGL